MSFNPGTQVGPYRIIEQLGQGGMAIVYKAYHASLDRYVAIKVLHRAFLDDAGFLARFQREARVIARLEHPNIVPVYDYAEHEGQPYLAMKYIEGDTLKARMQKGPLTSGEVTHIVESVGAGLAYAHRQGILHRDVKPSNVINANDGQIYLADFGLARIAQSGDSSLTSDMIVGTPQYISPEQAMAKKDLDEGTDVYSFGVMLYEMTVGRVPFSSDTPFAVIHDHIFTPLPLPSSVNPNISPALERMLLKALSKERIDRYKDVPEMIAAFKEAWTSSTSTMALTPAAPAPAAAPVAQATASTPLTLPAQPAAASTLTAQPTPAAGTKKSGSRRWLWVFLSIIPICFCCLATLIARPNLSVSLFGEMEATVDAMADGTNTPPPPTDEPVSNATLDPEMSLAQAERLVQQNPRDGRAHMYYGFILIKNDEEVDGYAEIKKGANLAARNQAVLLGSAKAFEERDAWLAAAIIYMQLAENTKNIHPSRVEAMHRAVYYGFTEEIAPEVLDYDTIGAVSQPLSLIAQVRYYLNDGDDEDLAETLLNQLEESQPDLAEAKLLRAELLIDQNEDAKAKTLLQELTNSSNISLWIKAEAQNLLSDIE